MSQEELINYEINLFYKNKTIIYNNNKYNVFYDIDNNMYLNNSKKFYLTQIFKYISKYSVKK